MVENLDCGVKQTWACNLLSSLTCCVILANSSKHSNLWFLCKMETLKVLLTTDPAIGVPWDSLSPHPPQLQLSFQGGSGMELLKTPHQAYAHSSSIWPPKASWHTQSSEGMLLHKTTPLRLVEGPVLPDS